MDADPESVVQILRSMTTPATISDPGFITRPFRRYLADAGLEENHWTISLRTVIQADAFRLSQAFTRPEYLETWVRFPGDDATARLVSWQEGEGYRLDHYLRGQRDAILRCHFHVRRRRKLLFTWRLTADTRPPESLVLVRMRGNFDSTIVELHHRGASPAAYRLWQEAMWQASLHRLADLFAPGPHLATLRAGAGSTAALA